MDDLKKITDQIEYLFLIRIADSLDGKIIELQTAKDLATKLLQIEPFISFEDTKVKVQEFTKDYPFLNSLNKFIDGYYEEQKKHLTIEKMQELMKQGKIDEALQVVQK